MKKRVVFDIAPFCENYSMSGIPRMTYEILKRLRNRDDMEIVLFCSRGDEESAWGNVNELFGCRMSFQYGIAGKESATDESPAPRKRTVTFLRRLEDFVHKRMPKNRLVSRAIESARRVKWFFFPPSSILSYDPAVRRTALEDLVVKSDVYFSTYYAPVPEIDANPRIRKIQVVCDVIPVLFPQWYPEALRGTIADWENIGPDVDILAISRQTERDLIRCFPQIRPERITVIPLGADERFAPCFDRKTIDEVLRKYRIGRPYILSVATLEVRKNLDHVIRSFSKWVERYGEEHPDVHLVLTGGKGWFDEELYEAYVRSKPAVKKRIVLTGFVTDEELRLLYGGAFCFCYMSLYEGFGLPPLEAMQSGTPVVASDTSSLPEVVGDAGILLDPHDEDALVETWIRLLRDEPLRTTLIEKGLERSKKFSWDRCVDVIVETIFR